MMVYKAVCTITLQERGVGYISMSLAGEFESSIIQQSMLLQCLSCNQSLDELISIVAVNVICRPQLHCKGIMKRKHMKTFSCFAMIHS